MITSLTSVAAIYTAVVFRDKAPQESDRGNVRALAIRDVVANKPVRANELPRVLVEPRYLENRLQPGDVVIPSRGDHYKAWYFDGADEPVLPIGQLNVIRAHPLQLNSHYLTWFLNQRTTQTRFQALLTGTNIKALTKVVLSRFEITVPPRAKQEQIAELHHTTERIAQIRHRLSELDRLEMAEMTYQLLQQEPAHA